jgi:hypothetical protein
LQLKKQAPAMLILLLMVIASVRPSSLAGTGFLRHSLFC